VTADLLNLELWLARIAFLILLYLVLFGFARAVLRDLRAAEASEASARAGLGRLHVVESPAGEPPEGRSVALGAINSLGRDVNNTIFIEDDFASARHAMLTFRGRAWFLEDEESTNGTFVNGHRIDRPVALSYGDEIAIGRVRMRLER
jgi:pSer/pThr/pTyr-binding forkhead associated (FHA) protein